MAFSGKTLTVFNGADVKEQTFVAWPVKEATFKNGMGVVGTYMLSLWLTLGPMYPLGQAFFCVNYTYTVWNLMTKAVTKIDLLEDGQKVNLTFGKINKTLTVAIKDIQKVENERALVETFEEAMHFPIRVGKETFYIHGQGMEAVKNGELFRAIINGQSIKLH